MHRSERREPDRSPPRLDGRCRDCGQPVRYARTRGRDALIVLDHAPTPAGRVLLTPALYGQPVADVLTNADLEVALGNGDDLYTVHAQTCVAAAERRHRAATSGWW